MKKRIFSGILALTFVLSCCVTAFAGVSLMAAGTADKIESNAWRLQQAQFDAMTEEQAETVRQAWTNYEENEANQEAIKALAEKTAGKFVEDNKAYFENGLANDGTLNQFYQWKIMRDIMEGKADFAIATDEYQAWLGEFTAYETANDEGISATNLKAALDQFDGYADTLANEYMKRLATMYVEAVANGTEMTGADAAKVGVYMAKIAAYLGVEDAETVLGTVDEAAFNEYLKNDVVDSMTSILVNLFEISAKFMTGNSHDGDGAVLGDVTALSIKSGTLLVGKEFAEKFIGEDGYAQKLDAAVQNLDKSEFAKKAVGDATQLLDGTNATAVDAFYSLIVKEVEYAMSLDDPAVFAELKADVQAVIGSLPTEEALNEYTSYVKNAMKVLNEENGVELIHFNTYLGRALLNPVKGSAITVTEGETKEVHMTLTHSREWIKNALEGLELAQITAEGGEGNISVELQEGIGYFTVDATAAKAGDEAVIKLYRGYAGDDKDVYRYVGEYKVVVAPIDAEITMEDIADIDVDESFTVKGTTNLPYVTVAVNKIVDDELTSVYVGVFSKAEYEEGFTLPAPAGAAAGDQYIVTAGTEKAAVSKTFKIKGAESKYTVTLEDVADIYADGTVVIKGETNLPNVVVVINKNVDGGFASVFTGIYTAEEFKNGIELPAPEAAEPGDTYTVVVGTEIVAASDEFTILDKEETYYVTMDEISDKELGTDADFTVKAETNLPHVVVAVTKGDKSVFVGVYSKAEIEAGVTLPLPAGAKGGDNYTVAVGTELASDAKTFAITEKSTSPSEPEEKPTLAVAGNVDAKGLSVKKNNTKVITTTPQNIPEGATAEVRVKIDDETIAEVVKQDGDYKNLITVKGLKKGTTTATIELVVDGVVVDTKTVEIKVTNGNVIHDDGLKPHVDKYNMTVKEGETAEDVVTKNIDKYVVDDESIVKVVSYDPATGKIVIEGLKPGTTAIRLSKNGSTEAIINVTVTKADHKCEWPDIVGHWAHQTIDTMTINGYINGYDDGNFKPDQNITRGEFSAIVYRILGLTTAKDGVIYDDTDSHWARDIIATMSLPEGYGMLRGYGDGNFGPNDPITREQAVAIIARAKSDVWEAAKENAKDSFTDAKDISWWFNGEIDSAVTNGLIEGYEDGSFKPLNNITRAEACVMLSRAWPEVLE